SGRTPSAARPSRTNSSITARKAASVLPEPVGAAMSTWRCATISGQAARCAGVGASKVRSNQLATAGWNFPGMTGLKHSAGAARSGAAVNSYGIQRRLRRAPVWNLPAAARQLRKGVKSPLRHSGEEDREMWDQDLEDASRRKLIWLLGAVVAAAIAAGGWYWYAGRAHPAAEAPPVHPAAPQPAANAAPSISHPIPGETGTSAALPALNDSDPVVRDSLVGVFGRTPIEQFLVPQSIVRHIVVTVDNLPRRKVAVELRPVKPT